MATRLSSRKSRFLVIGFIVIFLFVGAVKVAQHYNFLNIQDSLPEEDESVPSPVVALPVEASLTANDTSALGGYNVLIADRGNNRIIEVTPDKKIVWEYKFQLPRLGYGADDAFFTDGGKSVIVNLENYQIIQVIDYQTKQVTWQYGHPGVSGSADGYLSNPDDAYKLPNGDITVADIKNCRILEIAPDKHIVRQYGKTKVCGNSAGLTNKPNGDTPLPGGHMFISNIVGHNLLELDQDWKPIFSMTFPLSYPSDPQLTKAGNILISEYTNPGKVLEISKAGNIVWEFTGDDTVKMNKPSLAIELPNGNILSNDDYNHRIIVIDKKTKKIIWQYGVTGKPGNGAGQLSVPDGLDIIKHTYFNSPPTMTPSPLPLHTVGQVTRHASGFIGQEVRLAGYLLSKQTGYIIISDEATGIMSSFDLPATGSGIGAVQSGKKYIFQGTFLSGGINSSNNSATHLELSQPPTSAN